MEYLNREDITENVAIIKINRSYKDTLTATELYDCTRGCWKRKIESVQEAEYVLAVANGIVREVYKVEEWLPAHKLDRETIPYDSDVEKDRIGFCGNIANDKIRNQYIGKCAKRLFKRGEANPVKIILRDK